MPFVIISKNRASVPSDAKIEEALESVGGSDISIASEKSSRKAKFDGLVNHNSFQNALQKIAGGTALSWTFAWADGRSANV